MDYIITVFFILVSCTADSIVKIEAQNLTSCQNGGTRAISSSGNESCLCTDNYTGEYCEAVMCYHCQEEIFKAIFNNYVPDIRPSKRPDTVTTVGVYFNLYNLLDIIEMDEQMKVMGFFGLSWNDDRLIWDPDHYGGVTSIAIPALDVWLPDVIISNTGTSFYEYSYKRDFLVDVFFDGTVAWEYGGIIFTNCDIDMSKYPFDEQHCAIDIETWRYSKHEIKLVATDLVVRNSVYHNSLWDLTDYQAKDYLKHGNTFTAAQFSFTWKRKPLYYHMNIIIPALMMVIACLGVYWLPSESGEKVSLAVTILLAFSVFLIIIMDNTPTSSSHIPLITSFVLLVMAVTTLSLIISIFIAHLSSKKRYRVPKWLGVFFFNCLARLMCMSSSVPEYDEAMAETIEVTTDILDNEHVSPPVSNNYRLKGENDDVKQRLDIILKFIAKQEKSDQIEEEWIALGRVIDRLFFWISLILLSVLFPLIFLHII